MIGCVARQAQWSTMYVRTFSVDNINREQINKAFQSQCQSSTTAHPQDLHSVRISHSSGHNASIAHLLSNNKMSLIVGDINAHHSRWDTNTIEDERGDQLAD